jgi:excinuclease UvrABC nuclease subunit
MKLAFRSIVGKKAGSFAPWVQKLRRRSGVYIIRQNSGPVQYVGESHTGRLYDTLRRHFATWNDAPERVHFTYDRDAVEVAVIPCPASAAVGIQNRLITDLDPVDNRQGKAPEPWTFFPANPF